MTLYGTKPIVGPTHWEGPVNEQSTPTPNEMTRAFFQHMESKDQDEGPDDGGDLHGTMPTSTQMDTTGDTESPPWARQRSSGPKAPRERTKNQFWIGQQTAKRNTHNHRWTERSRTTHHTPHTTQHHTTQHHATPYNTILHHTTPLGAHK